MAQFQSHVNYRDHSEVSQWDSMLCCDAANVEDISELDLADINSFINGMIDYHDRGQIPMVDDMFQPGAVSAVQYGKRNMENAIELAWD